MTNPRIKHLKRGSTYEVLGDAPFQVSTGNQLIAGKQARTIKDGDLVRVYQDEATGKLYARFPDEFTPDRFEDIPDQRGKYEITDDE